MPTLADVLTTGRGEERSFHCPVHNDRNPSASVNVVKGVWFCFSCGAGGTADQTLVEPPDVKTMAQSLFSDTTAVRHSEAWLDMFDAHQPSPYWAKRVGWATAARFRCGTHPVSGKPTYPMRGSDAGYPVMGVVIRDEEGDPKYKYPFGVPKSTTLFNIEALKGDRRYDQVVLVESAGNVMGAYQALEGFHRDDWVVFGCWGSSVHKPQRDLILNVARPKRIITIFDGDKAGRAATMAAKEQFATVECVSVPMTRFNDLLDMPLKERRTTLIAALEG